MYLLLVIFDCCLVMSQKLVNINEPPSVLIISKDDNDTVVDEVHGNPGLLVQSSNNLNLEEDDADGASTDDLQVAEVHLFRPVFRYKFAYASKVKN